MQILVLSGVPSQQLTKGPKRHLFGGGQSIDDLMPQLESQEQSALSGEVLYY